MKYALRLPLLALLVWAMASASAAYANGRVVDFVRQTAGPYEIALGTIPSDPVVGRLHLTMTITVISTQELVLDAGVAVSGTGPDADSAELGPIMGQNNPSNPAFYDVNTSVDRVGTWTFNVSVDGEAGQAATDFSIEVKRSTPIGGIVTMLVLVALVIVVGLSLRAYLSDRGKRRRRTGRAR